MTTAGLISQCWEALGDSSEQPRDLELTDREAWLGGPLAVDDLAVSAVASALMAGSELAVARTGRRPVVGLSGEHAALSFQSERQARMRGAPLGAGFAPLSRFVACAEGGWVRTHGNYPHHASALRRALGIDTGTESEPTADRLLRAAASLTAGAIEEAVVSAGGCAAAVRSPQEWSRHPVAVAARRDPLVAWDRGIAVRSGRPLASPGAGAASAPAAGVRVLDLTRVIAGPVAGRTLAALGAEVLRIDSPSLPELPAQHLDTGPGKRSALLDLAEREPRERLLGEADVILVGYRHGALKRLGLDAEHLAERHPNLVQVSLSAWGTSGVWADRRGFDSLVQAACGIATITGRDRTPGALPAQALDHATGHLMAAAALHGLSRRARGQDHHPARVSLTRTAAALLDAPRPAESVTEATGMADRQRHAVAFGELELISPPGTLDGVPLSWPHGPRPFGLDAPAWSW